MINSIYEVINNGKEMQLEISLEGEKAYLAYRYYKNDITLMHTFVPPALEGRGIASALAVEAFRFAREHKKPVMIYCPFVAEFIKKHPEYNIQLDPEYHHIS